LFSSTGVATAIAAASASRLIDRTRNSPNLLWNPAG
jgi:hypothetical protein